MSVQTIEFANNSVYTPSPDTRTSPVIPLVLSVMRPKSRACVQARGVLFAGRYTEALTWSRSTAKVTDPRWMKVLTREFFAYLMGKFHPHTHQSPTPVSAAITTRILCIHAPIQPWRAHATRFVLHET
jgi:hypothetical protein